ncbi:hypothetical protein I5Q34_16225 [Streptomyces sp. AV19]|uniref:hypothetical protein n=1 Tax=Streptomyces sp. AV19 TaxID=2793068 RepID=UPI0018FE941B|nr:hypothetical protein [Streptomyces sp. AV19]MBH1935798.1 hypothetical protein [Streptomyces sp. AV19]MDG4536100.1 hypothetical protein [Streptomyces sp. AV19]
MRMAINPVPPEHPGSPDPSDPPDGHRSDVVFALRVFCTPEYAGRTLALLRARREPGGAGTAAVAGTLPPLPGDDDMTASRELAGLAKGAGGR